MMIPIPRKSKLAQKLYVVFIIRRKNQPAKHFTRFRMIFDFIDETVKSEIGWE